MRTKQIIHVVTTLLVSSVAFSQTAAPSKPYRPNFTSPLYDSVIRGEAPASSLPNWHGFHFWNAGVAEKVVPQLNGWTEHLYNAVATNGNNLISTVPRRIEYFCPKYKTLDREKRIAFWVRLISVMASYESSYNPNTKYLEPRMKVLSSGLMQISHASSQLPGYHCTMISPILKQGQLDLYDPKKNLSCAVNIINHFVGRDGTMVEYDRNPNGRYWKGLARYWGVFRHQRIKAGDASFWSEISGRQNRWQQESTKRDYALLQDLRDANVKAQPWGNLDWEARNTSTPHPSLREEVYKKEERHPLTSILRQINQTAFCYE
ncbi:MAG TPA: transglycosylase SLT domain-containing protein [Bdellovibrionales bacterium]|nr:transglycosylase SLT domain-containing protein [Bdellovibrionales bacterium]